MQEHCEDDATKQQRSGAGSGIAALLLNGRRRFAPLLLVVAALGIYAVVGPRLPHDHDVSLDLGPASRDVTHVEVAWTDVGANADPIAVSTQWNFMQGTAPEKLHTHVRLADGPWQADVLVDRNGSMERASWSRRIYLEGTQVILPLREALR
jgi:hypothetical protein